jgi:iron complex transport system permease protein
VAPPHRAWRLALLVAAAACAAVVAARLGVARVSFTDAWRDPTSNDAAIVTARLCRVLLGAAAGGALAVVGAAFQALLRNPLGDPYALGISGGAALGATIAVLLGAVGALVPLAAFAGALGATAAVLLAARASGRVGAGALLIAGLVFNACTGAARAFLRTVAASGRAQETLSLLLGVVTEEPPARVALITTIVLVGGAALLALAKPMNLLAHGDDTAASLGVQVGRARVAIFLAASLVVAAVVSVCGLIPFVGLIVPHYVRAWLGADHRWTLPGCFFAGAALLVTADLAARMVFLWLGTEPPVGALTALVGGPFFLVMLRALREE